jgi:hypothetical protein
MVTIETRLTGPALGAIIFLLCCVSIILGFGVGLLVAAAALGAAWIILCVYRPLFAFSILFLVFVLAYARLGLPLISVEGPGNRGVVALGDLLWLGLMLAWATRRIMFGKPIRLRTAYPAAIWAMLPFDGNVNMMTFKHFYEI